MSGNPTQLCACRTEVVRDEARSLDELRGLRDVCAALCLLIPHWDEYFGAFNALEADSSEHRSMLLLAFERGHLGRITSLVHRYLLLNDKPHPALTRQYSQDLRERWLVKEAALTRHRRSKSYLGKLMEP